MSSRKRKLAAGAIANNDDHLIEILVHLPIKSLLRFKSICKHWLSLISSPQFSRRLYPDVHLILGILLHRNSILLNPERDFVPLTNKPICAPFKCLTFVNHRSGLRISQSCHGLLCCSSFRDKNFKHDYYIYNPTTKLFVTLPPPGGHIVHGITLAYDPSKSPHYKVVCFILPDSAPRYPDDDLIHCQIKIYSSEKRSWRLSGDPFIVHINTLYRNGVHWVHGEYFNVDEEQLREMLLPPAPIGRRITYFGEPREHLNLVQTYCPCSAKFDIYEMESDYSGWFLKYHVDLNPLTIVFPEMIRIYHDPSDFHRYAVSILGIILEANDAVIYGVAHNW